MRASLTYPWVHADPARGPAAGRRGGTCRVRGSIAPRQEVFARVWDMAHDSRRHAAAPPRDAPVVAARAAIPYLNEPWYC